MVCDVPDWAIGHLAKSVAKFNTHHKIELLFIHPRDAGDTAIQEKFREELHRFKPDIVNFEYFRTAGQLIEAVPELENYKTIVMHHNMRTKALYMWDWQDNPEIKDKGHLKVSQVLVHCNQTKRLLEDKGHAKDVKVIRYGFLANMASC